MQRWLLRDPPWRAEHVALGKDSMKLALHLNAIAANECVTLTHQL